MSDATGLSKLVPGFEFLQNLVKNTGAALPGIGSIGQWIAPTLDPAELDKRIGELRTVQFWLEQNARMLAATIQALEVQKMTLSTLQSMNVKMGDLREALTVKPKPPADPTAAFAAELPRRAAKKEAPAGGSAGAPTQAVDPMQWWGALTKQFADLATSAMKDTAADAAKALAGGIAKQSFEAATASLRKAATAPLRAVVDSAAAMGKTGRAADIAAATGKKAATRKASTRAKRPAAEPR